MNNYVSQNILQENIWHICTLMKPKRKPLSVWMRKESPKLSALSCLPGANEFKARTLIILFCLAHSTYSETFMQADKRNENKCPTPVSLRRPHKSLGHTST